MIVSSNSEAHLPIDINNDFAFMQTEDARSETG
ncbi:hypothetical protein P3T43_000882 [Paraburkholderia sp. GAS41]|jgi:hypothetical protein